MPKGIKTKPDNVANVFKLNKKSGKKFYPVL
jgi:hypothetical protein